MLELKLQTPVLLLELWHLLTLPLKLLDLIILPL